MLLAAASVPGERFATRGRAAAASAEPRRRRRAAASSAGRAAHEARRRAAQLEPSGAHGVQSKSDAGTHKQTRPDWTPGTLRTALPSLDQPDLWRNWCWFWVSSLMNERSLQSFQLVMSLISGLLSP